jgi:ribosome modulation factor
MAERAKAKKKAAAKKKTPMKADKKLDAKGPRKARKGDNSGAVHAVPDEVIGRHLKLIKAKLKAMEPILEDLNEARGVYRNARKLAKKEGVNLDAVDIILKLENLDQGKVLVDHADAGRYLMIMDSPLATQLDLFQNLQVQAPEVDARLQGRQAGGNAEDAENNPFTPGTEQFQAWAEGWAEGQNDNAEKFLDKSKGSATLQ